MEPLEALVVGAAVASVFFVIGLVVGMRSERETWTVRADHSTSHYCDGTFYVIMTESEFIKNYRLRVPPGD